MFYKTSKSATCEYVKETRDGIIISGKGTLMVKHFRLYALPTESSSITERLSQAKTGHHLFRFRRLHPCSEHASLTRPLPLQPEARENLINVKLWGRSAVVVFFRRVAFVRYRGTMSRELLFRHVRKFVLPRRCGIHCCYLFSLSRFPSISKIRSAATTKKRCWFDWSYCENVARSFTQKRGCCA